MSTSPAIATRPRAPRLFFFACALAGCNAIFGVEPGHLAPGAGGAGGAGGSGGDGGSCVSGGPAPKGGLIWANRSSTADTQSEVWANALALDPDGNVVIAGVHSGATSFGSFNLDYLGSGVDGEKDLFAARFDRATGAIVWAKAWSAPGEQYAQALAVDPSSGDLVITGRLEGTLSFGGEDLVSAGSGDIFLARVTKDGDHVWSKRFGDGLDQMGINVAIDAAGDILLAAAGSGVVNFGMNPKGSPESEGVYLAKLDASGGEIWSRYVATHFATVQIGLAVDPDRNIYLASPNTDINFDSSDLYRGSYDVAVVKFDPEGVYAWSRNFGGSSPDLELNDDQWASAIAFDPCTGDVIVTGGFESDLIFDDLEPLVNAAQVAPNPNDFAESDIFVARLRGSDGKAVWAKSFGDIGQQQGQSLSVDQRANIVLSGFLIDNVVASTGIDFGGGVFPPSPDDYDDMFIVKLTSAGDHLWSERIGPAYIQRGRSVSDPAGNVAIAGQFFISAIIGKTPEGVLMSGWWEAFAAWFDP
jgi:hypothetical protein